MALLPILCHPIHIISFDRKCNYLPAEIEDLAVIPDKPDSFARIDTAATEVTALDTHVGPTIASRFSENTNT